MHVRARARARVRVRVRVSACVHVRVRKRVRVFLHVRVRACMCVWGGGGGDPCRNEKPRAHACDIQRTCAFQTEVTTGRGREGGRGGEGASERQQVREDTCKRERGGGTTRERERERRRKTPPDVDALGLPNVLPRNFVVGSQRTIPRSPTEAATAHRARRPRRRTTGATA